MVVYRFKFNQTTVDNALNKDLLLFLDNLKLEDDYLNFKPSKLDVVFGTKYSITHMLTPWIKENVTYEFEYEEHSSEKRTLTQIKQVVGPVQSVHYLLPLFSVESYLEL